MKNATCFWINLLILFTLYILTCKLLKLPVFCYMYEKFVPNVDYLAESFKIINKPYFEHCKKSLTSDMHMKTFVHIIKRILNEKYPSVDFDFYLLSCAKNVHMGLYFNILTLHDHD